MQTFLDLFATYWEKSIQDGYRDVESFLQQAEAIVDLYKPVDKDGSHSLCNFCSLAHVSWVHVEFTLHRKKQTSKQQVQMVRDKQLNFGSILIQLDAISGQVFCSFIVKRQKQMEI